MSTPIRLLIGFGALGGVCVGSYLLHQRLSTETIEKKLIANGYQILSDYEDSDWTQILTNYKGRIELQKIDLKFGDFEGNTLTEDDKKTLKKKCKNALKLISNNDDYKKAEKWCTVPKKLITILQNKGNRILSTKEDDDTTDQAVWNERIKEYNKKEENVGKKLEGVPKESTTELKNNEEGRKEIKKACQTLLDRFHYDKDFESNLEKAELWCIAKNNK